MFLSLSQSDVAFQIELLSLVIVELVAFDYFLHPFSVYMDIRTVTEVMKWSFDCSRILTVDNDSVARVWKMKVSDYPIAHVDCFTLCVFVLLSSVVGTMSEFLAENPSCGT